MGGADPALQDGQAGGDHDLGAFPALGGQFTVAERARREVDQGVSVALRRVAQVDLGVGARAGCGQWAQRRAEDLGGFPVEPTGEFIAPSRSRKRSVRRVSGGSFGGRPS